MEEKEFRLEEVTNFELLSKSITYLAGLRPELPYQYLQDACAGAMVLLYELRRFYKHFKRHGNNEK